MKKYLVQINLDSVEKTEIVVVPDDENLEDYQIILKAWDQLKGGWRAQVERYASIIGRLIE